jgi:two-component system, NarL family, invasion response regulator UvrY
MNIIVCDDHPIVREGLARIIQAESDVASVHEADNAQHLLDLVRDRPWDLVVLDVTLPGRNGLDVLRQLKQERPRLPVLMLSVHAADQYAVRALRAGASGYLTKDLAPNELIKAVRTVTKGHKYLTAEVADRLAHDLERPADRPRHESLSEREFEVFVLLASGRSVKEIAAELCLSDKTISTYRTRILEKLDLRSNAEIVRYAVREGLVD